MKRLMLLVWIRLNVFKRSKEEFKPQKVPCKDSNQSATLIFHFECAKNCVSALMEHQSIFTEKISLLGCTVGQSTLPFHLINLSPYIPSIPFHSNMPLYLD